jgi:hypothetical protein
VDLMQAERDRRNALKVERDILFARYLTQPKNTRLAVEIKAIDHEIAKSVEDRVLNGSELAKARGNRAESEPNHKRSWLTNEEKQYAKRGAGRIAHAAR